MTTSRKIKTMDKFLSQLENEPERKEKYDKLMEHLKAFREDIKNSDKPQEIIVEILLEHDIPLPFTNDLAFCLLAGYPLYREAWVDPMSKIPTRLVFMQRTTEVPVETIPKMNSLSEPVKEILFHLGNPLRYNLQWTEIWIPLYPAPSDNTSLYGAPRFSSDEPYYYDHTDWKVFDMSLLKTDKDEDQD